MILQSLRFYVKSILGVLNRSAKSAFLAHLEALNLDFYEGFFFQFLKAEID